MPLLATDDLLQKNAFAFGLDGFHGRLGAHHSALVRRRAGFDGPGPDCCFMHRYVRAGRLRWGRTGIHAWHGADRGTSRGRTIGSSDTVPLFSRMLPAAFSAISHEQRPPKLQNDLTEPSSVRSSYAPKACWVLIDNPFVLRWPLHLSALPVCPGMRSALWQRRCSHPTNGSAQHRQLFRVRPPDWWR